MLERPIEKVIFASRWLLAPFYLGLVGALVLVLIKFVQKFIEYIPKILEMSSDGAILAALSLIDMSLTANLLLMVILSGYESFVSKIDIEDGQERPDWMGQLGFTDLKLKLMTSIVAISAIHLLGAFMDLERWTNVEMAWLVGIHMSFVVSAVLLAWMDRISHAK